MSASEILHILRGVCSALSAAHDQGLVHRDLKPENIFLQRHASGVVPKVLDFGLAKACDVGWVNTPPGVGSSAGLLVGTLGYMAPEQVAGDDVSPAWDVWAVGVITFEMLTATHPFRRRVAFAADGPNSPAVPSSGPRTAAMPEGAEAFFRSALATDRARRPSDALAFLAACEQALL